MTHYRERLLAGEFAGPESETEEPAVDMRTHDGLDALANERGHTWSSDGLTLAQKRAELGE